MTNKTQLKGQNSVSSSNAASSSKRKSRRKNDETANELATRQEDGFNFLKLIRKLWATRQTETIDKEENPDEYVKITIRELLVFIAFLLILCIITFGMTSPLFFYFNSTLQGQFTEGTTEDEPYISFQALTTMDDVWRYLKGPFLDALYTDWYVDSNKTEDTSQYVLNENRLMGLPRLRQLKVKNNSCVVHDDFKEEIKFCYDTYSEFTEDMDPFGKFLSDNDTNNTAWYYQSEKQLQGSAVQALTNKYSGAGFVKLLSFDRSESEAIIEDLFTNLWITRGTRVIFIDFTLYNANINLFCQVRLTMEFPATGGVVPSFTFRTSKLIRYVTPADYFIMACEILLIFFIVYYVIEEIIEIRKHGKPYFKTLWNIIDIVIILMTTVCIVFNIFRNFKVNEILDSLLVDNAQFVDFEFLCYWQMQFNNAVAGAMFIAWMKIFKYTSFNKTMTQLTETLARCAKDVAGFAVMFFIIFFAYAQLGYLIFGTQVYDFSTFHYSVYTLFRTILGDFDYEAIERAQRVLGPIYFLTYVFFVFFVLLNMFLAIINDTYGEVKQEIVKSEIELSNFLKRGYQKVLEKYNLKRDRIVDIQHALTKADVNSDKQIDFEEWRKELRAKGYADPEIEALFAKYDKDGDRTLTQVEQKKMFEDMAKEDENIRKALQELEEATEKIDQQTEEEAKEPVVEGVRYEDYNKLSDRIDSIEGSLDGILVKIDSILMKIDLLEKSKREKEKMQSQSTTNESSTGSASSTRALHVLTKGQHQNDLTQSFC